MRALTLIFFAAILAGCNSSKETLPVAVKPRIDPVPVELRIPCEPPVTLPDRELSQNEVEKYWSGDRGELSKCGARHAAHAASVSYRDAEISGRKQK